MAKTSRNAKAKRPVNKKASAAAPAEDDHVDGCDFKIAESEATADADLPAASGGVEVAGAKRRR